jgi:hypothetical protein
MTSTPIASTSFMKLYSIIRSSADTVPFLIIRGYVATGNFGAIGVGA